MERKYNGIIRTVVGSIFAGLGAIGMFVMGIIGSTGDYEIAGASYRGGRVVVIRGFKAYLKSQKVEWLFVMCAIALIVGILVMLIPKLKKGE